MADTWAIADDDKKILQVRTETTLTDQVVALPLQHSPAPQRPHRRQQVTLYRAPDYLIHYHYLQVTHINYHCI